jgi:hypothetical protein
MLRKGTEASDVEKIVTKFLMSDVVPSQIGQGNGPISSPRDERTRSPSFVDKRRVFIRRSVWEQSTSSRMVLTDCAARRSGTWSRLDASFYRTHDALGYIASDAQSLRSQTTSSREKRWTRRWRLWMSPSGCQLSPLYMFRGELLNFPAGEACVTSAKHSVSPFSL